MNGLKIAFAGLGSIGTRHLKNVCAYLSGKNIEYVIDLYRSGRGKALAPEIEEKINNVFNYSPDTEITEKYDAVFITNPTSLHYETLKQFQKNAEYFFIEKPVFDSRAVDMSALGSLDEDKCYVACPLRYNPVIEYIKQNIDVKNVLCARAISSSYLPDWRPGTDYRTCYSAHTDMGGGVDIDLIHEWDYLTHLFGEMEEGYSISGKISPLEIDSNDIAIYIARTKNTTVELHLDYLGRSSIRSIELFMPDDTVKCDILGGKVTYLKAGKEIEMNKERNYFQLKEIEHFFDIVFGKIKSDSTVSHAIKVLDYAKGVF